MPIAAANADNQLDRLEASANGAELRLRAAAANMRAHALEAGLARLAKAPGGGSDYGGTGDFRAARRKRTRAATESRRRAGSADSHRSKYTLHELRKLCQSALRNDKFAASLVRRLGDLVVGDSIRVQVRSKDPEFNKAAERYLSRWYESCEHGAPVLPGGERGGRGVVDLSRLAIAEVMQSGDLSFVTTREGFVQPIEAERLVTPTGRAGDPCLVNGLEFDAAGQLVAYHVAEWDRGGWQPETGTRRIAAGDMLYMPCPTDDRANLTRPEPGLSRVVDDLEAIREYIAAVAVAAQQGAMFGLVTKTMNPADTLAGIPGGVLERSILTDGTTEERTQVELAPGFNIHLEPGEDIKQIKPEQPVQSYEQYLLTTLSLVSAEAGLPLVIWLQDFRQVNFSSARTAVLIAWMTVRVWRRWLCHRMLRPMSRWRLAKAIQAGEIEGVSLAAVPEDWDRMEFYFPPMPVLDPKEQYDAEVVAINNGVKTFEDVVRQFNGTDLEEHMAQLAAERKARERLGILPVGDPGTKDPNMPAADRGDGRNDPPPPPPSPPQQPRRPDDGDEEDDDV